MLTKTKLCALRFFLCVLAVKGDFFYYLKLPSSVFRHPSAVFQLYKSQSK